MTINVDGTLPRLNREQRGKSAAYWPRAAGFSYGRSVDRGAGAMISPKMVPAIARLEAGVGIEPAYTALQADDV